MTQPKGQDFELKIDLSGAKDVAPIYANHSFINLNQYDSTIVFAYIDGMDVAERLFSQNDRRPVDGKPVAKIVLSHRAMMDLAKALQSVLTQAQRDNQMPKENEPQEKK